MIFEFAVNSREMSFIQNGDGTHTLRIVQTGSMPLEFTCILEPYLRVQVDVDNNNNEALSAAGTKSVVFAPTITFAVDGTVRRDANHNDWVTRVLDRDDCGRPRGEKE
jgi:hypothetical protein